jgi:hypothetical protein
MDAAVELISRGLKYLQIACEARSRSVLAFCRASEETLKEFSEIKHRSNVRGDGRRRGNSAHPQSDRTRIEPAGRVSLRRRRGRTQRATTPESSG